MTILTAKVAGCPHVTACTPPIAGKIPANTVAAMHLAGADDIYILGGVQAVAAMAIGTPTIKKVNFIAGPGNAFVAEAKRQLFGEEIGIDLPAGPTEILIVADEHADPFIVATDLLSQAEHGPDSPAVLITTSTAVGEKTISEVDRLLKILPTADIAGVSWDKLGEVNVVSDLDEAYKLADEYAYEHVQILTQNPREALVKMSNYGALFLGQNTCVSYGDKCIGTNHVLPTRGAARYTGGCKSFIYSVRPRPAQREASQDVRNEYDTNSCLYHSVGGKIPAHSDIPRSHRRKGERRTRSSMWSVGTGGEFRGTCEIRRCKGE